MTDSTTLVNAQATLAATRTIEAPAPSQSREAMRAAADQFEAVFISEMFGYMNQGISTDGPFGGGHGEAMMRSLMNDEYAKSVAARGGVGLSDNVYRELLAIQEGTPHAGAGTKGQQ